MPWTAPKEPKGARGYGYQYQKLRKALLPKAYGTPCVRCGQPMLEGQKLHLDHDDWDRTKLRGFAHAACNIRAAAKKHEPSKKQPRWRRQRPASQYTAGNTPAFLGGTTGSPARDHLRTHPIPIAVATRFFAASQLDHSRETTSTHSKMFNV
jgi:hypothetical protein